MRRIISRFHDHLLALSYMYLVVLVLTVISISSTCSAFSSSTGISSRAATAGVSSVAATANHNQQQQQQQQHTQSQTQHNNNPLADFDYISNDELPWHPEGYQTWEWKQKISKKEDNDDANDDEEQTQTLTHKINYIELGDRTKPKLLLIHGFGASSYHFRYNLPELARRYHVFAFCKLGFGLSDKPVQDYQDYSFDVWKEQTSEFIKHVMGGKPTTIVGNSIGGYTAMYTAAYADDDVKDMINGVVLLNAAGRFKTTTTTTTPPPSDKTPDNNEVDETMSTDATKEEQQQQQAAAVAVKERGLLRTVVNVVTTALQRWVIAGSFLITKQPARIEQILKQVYAIDATNVNDKLIESIRYPSDDPNAAEVFYRVITKNSGGGNDTKNGGDAAADTGVYIDDVLETLRKDTDRDVPILLCWGEYDPWIRSSAADAIQALYPNTIRTSINAGHCPHDEAPRAVNAAIREFMEDTVLQ